MKTSFIISSIIAALLPFSASSSTDHHEGPSPDKHTHTARLSIPAPQTVDDLVTTSDVIVRGHFGSIVSQSTFYGYGRTRESLKLDRNLDDSQVEIYGIPMTEYEIVVDEVISGDNNIRTGTSLIYRKYEVPHAPYTTHETEAREGEFIFFLAQNPDAQTYGVLSTSHILKRVGQQLKKRDDYQWKDPFGELQDYDIFMRELKNSSNMNTQHQGRASN